MRYADRKEAGILLAARLRRLAPEDPVVVALARGGVPIGVEIAGALGAPLDVLAVRKLGAPYNPELGVGAIAEGGAAAVDPDLARRVGMTQEVLDEAIARETGEVRRRAALYHRARRRVDLRGRTVIVADDGLATGLTALAAVRAVRSRGARRVVLAVPVGAPESLALLSEAADEVVCPAVPDELVGVGRWYEDFSPVSDAEVLALLDAAPRPPAAGRELTLDADGVALTGELTVPASPRGLVVFAHGSGSSRLSPRNRAVAARLAEAGFATLLFDLLSLEEERRRELVFDIGLLARRLELATRHAAVEPEVAGLPIGWFGASTGAAAALRAAADAPRLVQAVVSRGGRPDLAAEYLAGVDAPTLLIVGSRDEEVLELNRRSAAQLRCPHRVVVIEGAGHLFEEPTALDAVATLASRWFAEHLAGVRPDAVLQPRTR